ncbi:TPA: hypothetical protein ACPI87_001734 [Haemophilus influenzae]|uniref:Uncharacterized protein n=1 Tax=Haemophilus influenzae TaxID=727 RepID=A0A2S9RPB8_HAEIF|nr:hypothetical protein [Haemophilus influenzae]AWP53460.1 hypothetical protein DLJ98_00945 [Haemophilus influenzae]PRI36669.1 hypothetical protein BVZ56_01037 [Haemophilus influenzae]PRI42842.1 hypothetical protein BVZ70_01612 [Haemophilus influenzae]PRI85153.1 hypothetical protein BV020_01910 [Haemophilus influenzae]PRI90830.1 hypothetical protein BV021_00430 [Haemophilus influenzae]
MGRRKSDIPFSVRQKISDQKRSVRLQSYKLHEDIIKLLAELSEKTGKSKTAIVTEGILAMEKAYKN